MNHRNRHKNVLVASLTSVLLLSSLAACAPEPSDVAGSTDKEHTESINPESEASEREVTEYEFNTSMPDSFPSDEFALPEGAVIEDVGERGFDQWYLLLRAADGETADTLWQSVIDSNGFTVSDQGETSEGGLVATLNGVTITALAATIPLHDGSVQLSYDIMRFA